VQFFFTEQFDNGFLHITLAGINDKSIKDIQVYRHEWRADWAIAEFDRLNFTKLLNLYFIHNNIGFRCQVSGVSGQKSDKRGQITEDR